MDLVDGRDFVCGIGRLDGRAKSASRRLVSGASAVPAVSSAAVDALLPHFDSLDRIEHTISPGNRAPRGAMPCLGLFTLDEALAPLAGFAIETRLETFTA